MGGSRGGSKRQGRGNGPKNAGSKVHSQGVHRPYWVKTSDRKVAEVLLADTSLGIKPKLDKAGALDMEVSDSKLVPFLEALSGATPQSPSRHASQPQSFSFVHLSSSERSRLLDALQALPTGSLDIQSDTATTVVISSTFAGKTPLSDGAATAISGQRGSHTTTELQGDATSASARHKGISTAEGGAASPKVFVPLYTASPDKNEASPPPASSAPLASPTPSEKLASPHKGSGARSALTESLEASPDSGREESLVQQLSTRSFDPERLDVGGSKDARAPAPGSGEHKGSVPAAEDGHHKENSDLVGQGGRGEAEQQRLSTPSKEALASPRKETLAGTQKEILSGARSEASPAKVPIEADAGSMGSERLLAAKTQAANEASLPPQPLEADPEPSRPTPKSSPGQASSSQAAARIAVPSQELPAAPPPAGSPGPDEACGKSSLRSTLAGLFGDEAAHQTLGWAEGAGHWARENAPAIALGAGVLLTLGWAASASGARRTRAYSGRGC